MNKMIKSDKQFRDFIEKKKRAESFVLESVPELGNDVQFFITQPNSYIGGDIPLDLFEIDNEQLISLAKAFVQHPADPF
jgi:hypothetical protein